jgi:drug/metabolite transporter (DMT)-like permease
VRREREGQGMGDVQTWLAMTFGVGMMGAALAAWGGVGWPGGYATVVWLGGRGPIRVGAVSLIAFMGAAVYCGGYTLWLVALEIGRRAGEAHKLPPLTYLTPVIGVALGWVLLHEAFGAGFWQGAGLIAAGNGVILAVRSTPRVRAAARAGGPGR